MESTQHTSFIAILLMLLHTTTSNKPNARPVYEVINEQARIDDKIRISNSPGVLPYGNPLAGNSKQNARIHISNQQAMFNAERVRQHRAQLQKLAKNPQPFDSYMKAYHDSQDNHQFALEQQQATLREIATKTPPTRVAKQKVQNNPVPKQRALNNPPRKRIQNNPEEVSRVVQNQREDSERRSTPIRKTTDGTPIGGMKYRNQRSYGPVEYQQYLYPQIHRSLNYVTPGPTYDQGVTIKPNGNIGFNLQEVKSSKLYTEAGPSDAKYVYPKQYNQMLNYKTIEQVENIDTLPKSHQVQLSELHSVQNSDKDENDIPIDFYFYLKNPTQELSKPYEQLKYAQLGNTYASGYMSDYVKDHIPITEEVDDIEDPNAQKGVKYIAKPETTPTPQETTTIKTNHYYKIEVASQTISTEHKPNKVKEQLYYKQEDTPSLEDVRYPSHYAQQTSDSSERYLHHNAQHVGVQHLTEDGTGVSAFGDDDLQYAANYEFGYRVDDQETGNYFGHQEAKTGKTTSGHYHVLLPDGRMQKVDYSAGPGGFHADISYDHLNH